MVASGYFRAKKRALVPMLAPASIMDLIEEERMWSYSFLNRLLMATSRSGVLVRTRSVVSPIVILRSFPSWSHSSLMQRKALFPLMALR